MWLACFLGSLCVLGLLHGAYGLAVMLRVLDPLLYAPMAGPREAWSIVLLNSVNLAVACSTFSFSFGSFDSARSWPSGPNSTALEARTTAWECAMPLQKPPAICLRSL